MSRVKNDATKGLALPFSGRVLRIQPMWILPRRAVLTVNVRGPGLRDLQIVCGAGPYELDLLLREQPRDRRLRMEGQVTRAEQLFEPVPSLALALLEAEASQTVSTTATDDFGEFGFRAECDGTYGLRMGEGPHAPCVLIWEEQAC